jgi:nitrile hydratase accessory protein
MTVEPSVAAMTGVAALPRSNGELIFEELWHARVFGLAVALVRERQLPWEEFQSRLIDEIGRWQDAHRTDPDARYHYYEHWARALERLVLDLCPVSVDDLEAAIRTVGIDDAHDHSHDHQPSSPSDNQPPGATGSR